MIKTYYYQSVGGDVWGMDQELDEQELMENARAMQKGFIKIFRCPFTEEKGIRCFGVIDGGVK